LRISSWCLTSTDSATTERHRRDQRVWQRSPAHAGTGRPDRAPPDPTKTATRARVCSKLGIRHAQVTRPNVIRPTTTDCRAAPDKGNIQSTAGRFAAVALNMNNMLSFLSNTVERVVVDRTGLQEFVRYRHRLGYGSRLRQAVDFYSRPRAARTQAGVRTRTRRCLRDRSLRTPHTGLAISNDKSRRA
jgi:hypothetical protein